MAVAVHSTVLGPALGGLRMWGYATPDEGLEDALRLSAAMTLKAAAAGLDLGGGKGVICAPPGAPPAGRERRAMLLDFGDLVDELDGRYVTAEDVGTNVVDMVTVGERTAHVVGRPVDHGGAGDPSPFTALGVEAAMNACVHARFGSTSLDDSRIVVVGFGHVGERLAHRLLARGAEVIASDVDRGRRRVAEEMGARWIEPEAAMGAACDILAPCALGGAVNRGSLPALRCAIVCGSANNQLAADELAADLAARNVLYAPDFIVNAGGLIHVYRELRGCSARETVELVLGIEPTIRRILEHGERHGVTPLAAARELAERRLQAASAR